MRRLLLILLGGAILAPAAAHEAPPVPPLLTGLGSHHHPITTASPEAQRYFDQGLILIYAFNHDEAARAFRHAAVLDPKAAMPHWGIALALGPNYNLDVDPEREQAAFVEIQRARKLGRGASDAERAYVDALAHRFSDDPKVNLNQLARDYKGAMGALVQRFPDDLDAATLYAESAMDLRPWQLWNADGTPAEGTEEIVAVLESVLRRAPEHPGANHFYIHAVEASRLPERALPSARRLETLVPAAGHLVHMPAHVYMRTGDFAGAVQSNARAIEVDRVYRAQTGQHGGAYEMMYVLHNIQFLAAAAAMAGRYGEARRAADELIAHLGGHGDAAPPADMLPMIDAALAQPIFVTLRFHRWNDALAMPEPAEFLRVDRGLWHCARGMAFAAAGKWKDAEAERTAIVAARGALPERAMFGYNSAAVILDLAETELTARLATARGDRAGAVAAWTKAVALGDGLAYDEPADWYHPPRESLGAALLASRRAGEAEAVFRADLEQNPRNGRALFGLWQSLEAQRKRSDAAWVQAQFALAWRDADRPLALGDL
jgi:tetratricopeptide (TPR) repeat protein